jgi:hypothetical protein
MTEPTRALIRLRYWNGRADDVESAEPVPVALLLRAGETKGDVNWQPGRTPAELTQVLYRFVRETPPEIDPVEFGEDPGFREVVSGFTCTSCYEQHDLLYLVPGPSGDIRGAHRLCEDCYLRGLKQ